MSLDNLKYRQAILYFLHHCSNEHLGRVKLMKLLYFLDFDHFERYRTLVTGDRYRRLDYGPVPSVADQIIDEMANEGYLEKLTGSRGPYSHFRLEAIQPCNVSVFSTTELATLQAVAERWKTATTAEIVDATHEESPWLETPDRQYVSLVHALNRRRNQPVGPKERENIIQSVITSQALEGVDIQYAEAAAAFDEVFGCNESLPL